MTRLPPEEHDPSPLPAEKQRFGIQVVLSGLQDVQVIARSASAAGKAHGTIAVRIGRVLVYVEDRDALLSLSSAVAKARELQDGAFGRPGVYRSRPLGSETG